MPSSYIGKVFDNYRIIENIGIGGMGLVFKAIHIKLDKIFALKMIAPSLTMHQNFIKRFQTEARALAKFEDPNIVRVYDLRSDNDQWYIVMEYVEGINLSDKIKKDGIYKWQEALPILKQVLTAISHAHKSGVIHRDIKPNNIMITSNNVVKITDFGLAKDQTNLATTLSISSGGTLYYMSPEHLRGFSFTDKRSDIYSIGITLYEMLTGHVPFINLESDYDIRESIVRKRYKKPREFIPELPYELEEIIMKSIAKNPDERYQDVDDLLEAIRDFESEYSVQDVAKQVLHKQKKFSFKDIIPNKIQDILKNGYLKKYGWLAGIVVVFFIILFIIDFSDKDKGKEEFPEMSSISIFNEGGPAMVFINGDSIGKTPLQDYQIRPGSYTLGLRRENFVPIDTLIAISDAKKLNLSFLLHKSEPTAIPDTKETVPEEKASEIEKTAKAITSLSISSNPPDAEIWFDNQLYGKTPLTLSEIDPGVHYIELRKVGFSIHKEKIVLPPGKKTTISPVLATLTGKLIITSDPSAASVWLNGNELTGKLTPVEMTDIPIGTYQIEIKKDGYASQSQQIEIKKDQNKEINVKLAQLEGKLSIQARPWGSIYINDKLVKESAEIKYQVSLPVDRYTIKIVHPTLGYWQKTIRLNEKNLTEIVVDFNRKATIEVTAEDVNGTPLSAEIFIDDESTGIFTPGTVNLRTGIHRIVVKRSDYLTEQGEKTILVDQKGNENQKFVLKKLK